MPEAKVQYEQMQLHDGEDEAKNVQLASLLAAVKLDDLNDWEGDQSGINIYLHVNEGDTIQVSNDGWIRVVRQTRMPDMKFTEKDMA
jgi:hypothetical protein